MVGRLSYRAVAMALALLLPRLAWGQEDFLTVGEETVAGDPACCDPAAMIPASPFAGELCSRAKLTSDWCGFRNDLAANGIGLDADVTQFYMGNVNGGLEQEFRYGGHADYVLNVDAGKLGLQQGMFIKLRAEQRFGESIGSASGALLPPTIPTDLPFPNSETIYLTDFLITQALSESFAVFAGKLDTFDADTNAFASGRGKTQFSNIGFVATPIALRTAPYSTLGAGFIILREGAPFLSFSVLNSKQTIKTSGFDELFEEGLTLAVEMRVPTTFFERPGHQLFGGTWSSRDVVALDQDPRIILPSVPIARQSGSWSFYYNFDQYLVVDPADPTRGWGIFGRAGVADRETNPVEWFLSFGVGGNSPIRGREADTFGAGWYMVGASGEIAPFIETVLGPIGDGHAVELFYNFAVTPWFHVTPDLQVLVPARENVDTSTLIGLRAKVDF